MGYFQENMWELGRKAMMNGLAMFGSVIWVICCVSVGSAGAGQWASLLQSVGRRLYDAAVSLNTEFVIMFLGEDDVLGMTDWNARNGVVILIQFKLAMGHSYTFMISGRLAHGRIHFAMEQSFIYHHLIAFMYPFTLINYSRFMLICPRPGWTLRTCHIDAKVGARQHAAGVARCFLR